MEAFDSNEGKAERFLKKIGHKIDEYVAKAKGMSGPAREEIDEQIENLKDIRDRVEEDISSFKDKHQETLDKIDNKLEKFTSDLIDGIESLFSSKKENDTPKKEEK